jgi:hypothetical protein
VADDQFKRILDLHLGNSSSLTFKENAISYLVGRVVPLSEASSFVEGLPLDNDQLLEYGIPSLLEVILLLNPKSTYEAIDKVRRRLDRTIDKSLENVTINGQPGYRVKIMWSIELGQADKDMFKGTPYEEKRRIALNEVLQPGYTLLACIKGLDIGGITSPIFPFGRVTYKGRDTQFYVVWALERQEFWVVLEPSYVDLDNPDGYVPPHERRKKFLGMKDPFSVGRLSGLMDGSNELRLEVLSTSGFGFHDVVRLDGTMQLV